MAYLFGRFSENVLDTLQADDEFADQFEGGFMDDADSNFLGIAIGKKAKARKKAKRDDRQAARKYKMETERIRALQGQPKQNAIKDIASSISSVAQSVFGGGSQQQQEVVNEPYFPQEPQQPNYTQNNRPDDQQPEPKNNTIIYIVIGVIAIGAAIYFLKKK